MGGGSEDKPQHEGRIAGPVGRQPGAPERRARKLWSRMLAGIGLGPSRSRELSMEASDTGTRLAQHRTNLALDRSYLAAERTLMAWIRTTLSMISFGFSMAKLFQAFRGDKGQWAGPLGHMYSVEEIGYSLVVIGTGGLIAAVVQHHFRLRRLRAMGLEHSASVSFVVAVLLCLLGVFAFSSLVLRL